MEFLMGHIVRIIIYLGTLFGVIYCFTMVWPVGLFLLLVAWVGFVGVWLSKKMDRMILMLSRQHDAQASMNTHSANLTQKC